METAQDESQLPFWSVRGQHPKGLILKITSIDVAQGFLSASKVSYSLRTPGCNTQQEPLLYK